MSATLLHQVWGNDTVDRITAVCSILSWDVKQNIMCARWNAMADGKTITDSSWTLYRTF